MNRLFRLSALSLLIAFCASCSKDKENELDGDWLFPIAKGTLSINSFSELENLRPLRRFGRRELGFGFSRCGLIEFEEGRVVFEIVAAGIAFERLQPAVNHLNGHVAAALSKRSRSEIDAQNCITACAIATVRTECKSDQRSGRAQLTTRLAMRCQQ